MLGSWKCYREIVKVRLCRVMGGCYFRQWLGMTSLRRAFEYIPKLKCGNNLHNSPGRGNNNCKGLKPLGGWLSGRLSPVTLENKTVYLSSDPKSTWSLIFPTVDMDFQPHYQDIQCRIFIQVGRIGKPKQWNCSKRDVFIWQNQNQLSKLRVKQEIGWSTRTLIRPNWLQGRLGLGDEH